MGNGPTITPALTNTADQVSALRQISRFASELGADDLAREAREQQKRLADARFFVACIGQLKRGKSTLLNALVGESVLPVGVVPVTSVITVLREGTRRGATVRLISGSPIDHGRCPHRLRR